MQFVVGSAIIIALVLLTFSVTVGSSACLKRLRHLGYILSFALAGIVTAGDVPGFALLLGSTLGLYEMTVWLNQA